MKSQQLEVDIEMSTLHRKTKNVATLKIKKHFLQKLQHNEFSSLPSSNLMELRCHFFLWVTIPSKLKPTKIGKKKFGC